MGLIHQRNLSSILITVLVVSNFFLNNVTSKALEETCPSRCICNRGSVTCSNLKLTEIPTINLEESVQSFDLSDNMLTQLKEFVFKEYHILETLCLSENQIDSVDPKAFSGLGMLKNIDLSCNNLEFIKPDVFLETPLLKKVSLKENPLVYVLKSCPILTSHSITSLDLSSCTLTSVDTHTFSQLPSLQVLNLNSNKLREFNRDILNTLTELRVMDLGNNMWKCDCNIVEVLNSFSERRKSRGLDGEHKPVKCFDAGVYKTIWTAARENELCTRQSRIFSEIIASTKTTTMLRVPKEEEISKPGSGKNELLSWNIWTTACGNKPCSESKTTQALVKREREFTTDTTVNLPTVSESITLSLKSLPHTTSQILVETAVTSVTELRTAPESEARGWASLSWSIYNIPVFSIALIVLVGAVFKFYKLVTVYYTKKRFPPPENEIQGIDNHLADSFSGVPLLDPQLTADLEASVYMSRSSDGVHYAETSSV